MYLVAETQKTEKVAFGVLVDWLSANGRVVSASDKKQYDLVVDGCYCELKAKRYSASKFDFIYVSENQYAGLQTGELRSVFLVCNTDVPGNIEIYELMRDDLLGIKPKTETKYYYDKGLIGDLIATTKLND